MVIHFIGTGNIIHSRVAEAILRSMVLPNVELMLSDWSQLTQVQIDKADITIMMNRSVYNCCAKKYSVPLKTYIWDIADDEVIKIPKMAYKKIEQHMHELVYFMTRKKPTTPVDVLDRNGNSTGETLTIEEMHNKGIWHAGVHVGLYTPQGKVLMEKRSETIIYKPGMWDVGYGGVVDAGETPLEAAVRECQEELGIQLKPSDLKLVEVFRENHYMPHYAFHNRCLVYMYIARITGHEKVTKQESEVGAVKTVTVARAKELLQVVHPLARNGYSSLLLHAMQQAAAGN